MDPVREVKAHVEGPQRPRLMGIYDWTTGGEAPGNLSELRVWTRRSSARTGRGAPGPTVGLSAFQLCPWLPALTGDAVRGRW